MMAAFTKDSMRQEEPIKARTMVELVLLLLQKKSRTTKKRRKDGKLKEEAALAVATDAKMVRKLSRETAGGEVGQGV